MRIIAGKYGGRRLVSFKADHIRPTTDRVKESVFNKLQAEMDGARVLDLYSGTGNLAFEALSRGAVSVEAVEMSKKSIAIIRDNARLLGVGAELTITNADVLKRLSKPDERAFDIVFADPPFTEKLAHETLSALARSSVFGPESLLMIEASSHERVDQVYLDSNRGDLVLTDRRDYGDKQISFFRRREQPPKSTEIP